ncbi:MAG: hypothetical protein KME60_11200 [Cyanomargarita calcarea GSE-NOS-MK-12-04C]|jgi:hypothetical protein|uniref:Uncharacterized protein n=1 Tax=Cyanomargarita calcarea GSE-NOS-MK-12-04C TaxID=2839659 RepID=A0A951QL82_9CYAN|nr:hypothetical protein [Cyanomargarita calcarea GSE-NOS-MK-12-04C]
MRILLIANTIFEIGIGCLFLFFPTLLLKDNDLSISLLRVIGCSALALGTLSFLMLSLTTTKELKPGLIALFTFHALVAIAQFSTFNDGITNKLVVIVHSLFAVSFFSVLWKRIS